MEHSGSVGRALVWYSHTAISEIMSYGWYYSCLNPIMEHSGSVDRALVWYSHTDISEICFHALCHMGGISLA